MGKHTKPRSTCALPYRHEGPAVQTPTGVRCAACGFAAPLQLVKAAA